MKFTAGKSKYEVYGLPKYWRLNSWGVFDCLNCAGRVRRSSLVTRDEGGTMQGIFHCSECHCTKTTLDVYKKVKTDAEKAGATIEAGS